MPPAHKAVFLGDGAVGKTAIIQRLSTGSFQFNMLPTVGGSFTPVQIKTPHGVVEFQVWDTAGQEKFRDLVPLYFRNAVIALVVYDITTKSSFENVDEWLSTLRAVSPDCIVAVIGNKSDLETNRVVSMEDGETLAERCGAELFAETSAFSGEGIDSLFPRLLELVVSRAKPMTDQTAVPLGGQTVAGKSDCC
jgi:small GTP-binding protein